MGCIKHMGVGLLYVHPLLQVSSALNDRHDAIGGPVLAGTVGAASWQLPVNYGRQKATLEPLRVEDAVMVAVWKPPGRDSIGACCSLQVEYSKGGSAVNTRQR